MAVCVRTRDVSTWQPENLDLNVNYANSKKFPVDSTYEYVHIHSDSVDNSTLSQPRSGLEARPGNELTC